MTEIPKEAWDKAQKLGMCESSLHNANISGAHYPRAFARYIADVSEKAKKARAAFAAVEGFYHRLPSNIEPMQKSASDDLASLILPDPEDDLLKEAREIVAAHWRSRGEHGFAERALDGRCDKHADVSCTLAALKKGRG